MSATIPDIILKNEFAGIVFTLLNVIYTFYKSNNS
jgi:hypothetical protein